MQGQLSKHVPARTKVVRFPWVRKGFSKYTEQWRAVRAKCEKPIDNCWWCKRQFRDEETINLAAREKGANVVLCDECADTALSHQSREYDGQ